MALITKHSNSYNELNRTTNDDCVEVLASSVIEAATTWKALSVLFLPMGKRTSRNFLQSNPSFPISAVTLIKLLFICGKIYLIKSNKTLNRPNLFLRKQENKFWNSLKRLAAKCDSGAQIESLVYYSFFLKMHNKPV